MHQTSLVQVSVQCNRPVFEPSSKSTSFAFNSHSKGHHFILVSIAVKNAILPERTSPSSSQCTFNY
jgi:hypothetical protein